MSDKGSNKGVSSLKKVVKPVVECKVFFIGKWNAGYQINDDILAAIREKITDFTSGGLKTKLRFYPYGLKVGEKSSLFSVFPEQLFPIGCIKLVRREEKQTNAIFVATQNDARIHEVAVYRCPTEYEAQKVIDCYERYKVKQVDMLPSNASGADENWTLRQNSGKKYPTTVISTAVNGINGHDETKVTTDAVNKVMHVQLPEPIYATVNKKGTNTLNLEERVRLLELENAQLREFIHQNLVTTYHAYPRHTEVPVEQMLMLEGNRLKPVGDEMFARSESGSLSNSGQFEKGSLQYQRTTEAMNGYAPNAQKEIVTRYLVPAETLRRTLKAHTHVERKIGDVYRQKPRVVAPIQTGVAPQQEYHEYQDVAESLPPRDSISSLSNSDMEDNNGNGELFEITTPTPVRYM